MPGMRARWTPSSGRQSARSCWSTWPTRCTGTRSRARPSTWSRSRGRRGTSTTPSSKSIGTTSGWTSDQVVVLTATESGRTVTMCPTRVLLGLLLGTGILLGLADAPAAEAQTPKRGGTLRVSYGNESAHLDFHAAPGYEMMWVAMNVGCGLVDITPDGKFVGDAAESWTSTPDGLLWTFKLRKNVLFHDGTPVDAAAVKFSIDRLKDPATKSGMRPFYEPVHSVEVLDPHTVQVRLGHPYAFFLHMLAAYRTGLVLYSSAATQKFTLDDRKQGKPGAVIGCGPFKFVEWVKGSHLLMERFDKYFVPGLPYLDKVIVRVIKDPVTEMAAFKAGEVDFIASFSPEHVDTMKAQKPKAQILTGKETTPMMAAMKVSIPKDGKPMSPERAPHPIFGELRVRKAIGCYGIDRQGSV